MKRIIRDSKNDNFLSFDEAINLYIKGNPIFYFNSKYNEWQYIPLPWEYSSHASDRELFYRGIDDNLDPKALIYDVRYDYL